MYCSGCGLALAPGQGICPQCGRPAAPPVPAVPGGEFEVQNYAGKVKTLAIAWFVYAGVSLIFGIIGLAFLNAFFSGFCPWMHSQQDPWMHGPMPFMGFMPAIMHFAWVFIVLRSGLALVAAWGLLERAPWGRIVAIVVAFLSLIKFPFGTAMGIWTLIVLLGYRNARLYEQL